MVHHGLSRPQSAAALAAGSLIYRTAAALAFITIAWFVLAGHSI